uniref:TATA-box-binding protein n=1 Tax=Chromera velia CCMP2878 TaxID=1169474 RepID=A0A0G4FMH0_9ALVE|mmetsp:Transcript_8533/g.16701  ORF Transcript_8533/g.16701 Transcript_8533/m.16701 type:complete len:205 (+) Transcript_8533:215-829(+)|eukprot:Cvel_17608.t1-p1 / transcript=Cvel_17608.t1 / gene=Cvel_17608 / organism=Chromera_velia_CCMP2878 / gene_product=TATA box-binding protein-like protein 2, putative / transcript_product=TATA box-binding protein-like protein 2, putative / location=Cvel_scaffold1416:25538-26149(-) / protein_length=204 / sequence_SO=supercontig / SO=protein_coding / is_pseudo=false
MDRTERLHDQLALSSSSADQSDLPRPRSPTVSNLICSVQTGCYLDLKRVYFALRNTEYNPKRTNAVIFRLQDPSVTAIIYEKGRVLITSAQSEAEARLAGKKIIRLLQLSVHPEANFCNFKVESLMANGDVCHPIRLEELAKANPAYASYEPEVFSGLVWQSIKPYARVLIWVTGSVSINGQVSQAEVQEVFRKIVELVRPFRS